MRYDLTVIGGGMAGLACAVRAGELGLDVLVLERMDKVGRKLLATGNGRCNLMNEGPLLFAHGAEFAGTVLAGLDAEKQKRIWERLGLRLRTEEGGRVYPASGQAATVLDVLQAALDRLSSRVTIRTGCAVTALKRTGGGFEAVTGRDSGYSRFAAVFGGGQAQPKLGSDGSALRLLEALGHTASPCRPSLCGLNTDKKPIEGLAGSRTRARITLLAGEKPLYAEDGEVIFAENGISGVCVMDASAFLPGGEAALRIDLLPALGLCGRTEAEALLRARRAEWAELPLDRLLTGLCGQRLASALCRAAGIRLKDRRMRSLTDTEAARLAEKMGDFRLRVTGTRGYDLAQVTQGGIRTEEADARTLRSLRVRGLWLGGEALDVDGLCGGFNLMFAFACGWLAAEDMGRMKETWR